MSKKHKKNKKPIIDIRTLAVSAIMDFIVGALLLLLEKLFE